MAVEFIIIIISLSLCLQIKKRVPSFSPGSLLDFGSGTGSVAWAAHSLWGESLKEFVCVDSSGAMNSLADLLVRGKSYRQGQLGRGGFR
nr:PREDICTED: methyltransferase-like protein 17, mitochondrial [Lepisosteus oculatus]